MREGYTTAEWVQARDLALALARYRCARPGCPSTDLVVHHKDRSGPRGNNDQSNLIVLCRRHHRFAHSDDLIAARDRSDRVRWPPTPD
jgi:hypothetical protein